MSKIPDQVFFGIDQQGRSTTYGDVRKVTNENELIALLKLRLQVFFLDQVRGLQTSQCAFPLSIMTCVGIETLGQIVVTANKDDQAHQFVEISKRLNQRFGRNPTKKFQKKLTEMWGETNDHNVKCYGQVLYRFFRNTMIHGYRAQAVFLSYEDTDSFHIDEELGILIINPNWFWTSFISCFNDCFEKLTVAQPNNSERRNTLNYIKVKLLD